MCAARGAGFKRPASDVGRFRYSGVRLRVLSVISPESVTEVNGKCERRRPRLHGSRCQTRLSPLVTAAPCSRPIAPFRFRSSRWSVAGAAPMSRTQRTQGQACCLEWRPELLDVVEGSEGTAVRRGTPRARSLKWVKTRRGMEAVWRWGEHRKQVSGRS